MRERPRTRSPRAPGTLLEDRMESFRACVNEVLPTFPGDLAFTGSDEGDYHVHAATISSRADVILTQNHPADITRTPDDELYKINTADDLLMLVVQSNPGCLLACTASQVEHWGPSGGRQLDDRLVRADCRCSLPRIDRR